MLTTSSRETVAGTWSGEGPARLQGVQPQRWLPPSLDLSLHIVKGSPMFPPTHTAKSSKLC